MRGGLALAAALVVSSAATSAQTGPAASPPRLELRIDAGAQGRPRALGDSFDVPLNQERERVSVQYPHRGGTFTGLAGRYQVWKQLTLGAGVTRVARSGDTAVNASVPHPFFDNQLRSVEGTASTRREETAFNAAAGWLIALSNRVHAVVSAGPAIVQVKQALVTGVKVTEEYPYDTATFAGANLGTASRSGAGVYAGADVTWLFSKHVGAGAMVQFTHARVTLASGDRHVSVDAGGVQAGGGVRLVF